MKIILGDANHIEDIIAIAHASWPATYSSIISQEQIDYMLHTFYNASYLNAQLEDDTHYFFMALENEKIIGYVHALPTNTPTDGYKISKLYLYPEKKGLGIGKKLLQHAEYFLLEKKIENLYLNVNRYNPALHFYKSQGYSIIQEIDIPLDKFWLNDFIMHKQLAIGG